MDTKDRAYIYAIASLLALSGLIGLEALYEAHQADPPITTLPVSTVADVAAFATESIPPAPAPETALPASTEPDHAAYPVDPREPDAIASKNAGLRAGESKAVILLVAVQDDDRVSMIDIDHTSGSVVTDGAAIAYARGLNWKSERKVGNKHSASCATSFDLRGDGWISQPSGDALNR